MLDPTKYSLAKNPRGYWEIRWSENRGDRYVSRVHSTRQTDEAKARLYFRHWLKAEEDFRYETAAVPFLRDLIDQYELNANQRRVGKTQYHVLARLREFFGDFLPTEVSEDVVARYATSRGVADPTLRRELGVLVAVMNFAVKKKRLRAGDVPHVDLPPPGAPREVYLSATEEKQFMDLLMQDPMSRMSRFCILALRTGARRAAIEKLTWDRVNFENRYVDYRDPGVRRTKKRRVPVPIDDVLYPILRQADVFARDEYVIGRGSTQRMWDVFRRDHPRFAHVTPHVLRHTAATRWLRDGLSLWEVAGLLGDTVETTTRVYGHHATGDLRAAMSRSAA